MQTENLRERSLRLRRHIARLADGSRTAAEISDKVGCTITYVTEIARQNYLPLAYTAKIEWTAERIERLTTLWLEGLSANQIATLLGGITREAVCGKVNRLGLKRSVGFRSGSNFGPRRRVPSKSATTPRASVQPKPISLPAFAGEPLPSPVATDVARVARLADLEAHHCKFPIGNDLPFGFCGLPRVPNAAYCPDHFARCHAPAPTRRAVTPSISNDNDASRPTSNAGSDVSVREKVEAS